MKYIKNYESFRQTRFPKEETMNEEFIKQMLSNIKGFFKDLWGRVKDEMKKVLGLDPDFEDIKRFFQDQFMKIFNTEIDKISKEFKPTDNTNNVLSNSEFIYRILFFLHNFLRKEGALNLKVMLVEISKVYKQNTPENNMIEYVIQEGKKQFILKMDGYTEVDVEKELKLIDDKIKEKNGQEIIKSVDTFYSKFFKNLKAKLAGQFGQDLSTKFSDKTKIESTNIIKELAKIRVKEAFTTITEDNYKKWFETNKKDQAALEISLEDIAKSYGIDDGKNFQKLVDDKTEIVYKRDAYDNMKKPQEQGPDATAKGVIEVIRKEGAEYEKSDKITIKNSKTNEKFEKTLGELLPKSSEDEEAQKNITDNLKKIKDTRKQDVPRVSTLLGKLAEDEKNLAAAQKALKINQTKK